MNKHEKQTIETIKMLAESLLTEEDVLPIDQDREAYMKRVQEAIWRAGIGAHDYD